MQAATLLNLLCTSVRARDTVISMTPLRLLEWTGAFAALGFVVFVLAAAAVSVRSINRSKLEKQDASGIDKIVLKSDLP